MFVHAGACWLEYQSNLVRCDADTLTSALVESFLPPSIAKFHWPEEVKSDVLPADIQQQCVEILNVASTMLTILESDPAHPLQGIYPVQYQWKPSASVWSMPSSKAWDGIIATTVRVISLLQWTHSPDVETLHRECLNQKSLSCVPLRTRVQETMLKILDQLLRGKYVLST